MEKRLFSALLALLFAVSLVPVLGGTAQAAGGSEGDPVICTTYEAFKAAMEDPSVLYVQINSLNDMIIKEGSSLIAGAQVSSTKTLILSGNSVITAGQGAGLCRVDSLIYVGNGGTLHVKGSGSLTFEANASNAANAVIHITHDNANVFLYDGITLNGSANGYAYGRAVDLNSGNLTIWGGSYTGDTNMKLVGPSCALQIISGNCRITKGQFTAYDHSSASNECQGIVVPTGKSISDYLQVNSVYSEAGAAVDVHEVFASKPVFTPCSDYGMVSFRMGHIPSDSPYLVSTGQKAENDEYTAILVGVKPEYNEAVFPVGIYPTPPGEYRVAVKIDGRWYYSSPFSIQYNVTPTYSVSVTNGSADASAYSEGETVTITADTAPAGQLFDHWAVDSGGVTLADDTAGTTTFDMGGEDVSVRAVYRNADATHKVNAGSLTVREGPDSSSARIGGLTRDDFVKAVETQGEWSRIEYQDGYGWVMSKYLTALEDPGTPTYTIGVQDGISDPAGKAAEGQLVVLQTTLSPEDFDHWQVLTPGVSLDSTYTTTTSFTMPAKAVLIRAIAKSATTYDVTVENGISFPSGSALEGDIVTITADTPPAGQSFDHWDVISGGVTLEDAASSSTTFTMPAGDVVLCAVWKTDAVLIDTVTITGVTPPSAGAVPTTAGIRSETPNVEVSNSTWFWDNNGSSDPVGTDPFEEGKTYLIGIYLHPSDGYAFADTVSSTVNGMVPESHNSVKFGPTDWLVLIEIPFAGQGPVNPFQDVSPSDLYYDSVLWAYYHDPQITDGMTDTTFGPGLTVTRGQCVTFLWRAMGKPMASSFFNPFQDVAMNDYYYDAVLWAVEKGITNGVTDTTFAPNDTLSTQHITTFLYRTLNPGKDGWDGEAAAWAGKDDGGKPFGVDIDVNNKTDCPRWCVVQFLSKTVK